MKIIKDCLSAKDISIEKLINNRPKTIDIKCPQCNNVLKLTETYINRQQEEEINYAIHSLNNFIKEVNDAILEIYGEDIRSVMLISKFEDLKKQYLSPRFEILKGGK